MHPLLRFTLDLFGSDPGLAPDVQTPKASEPTVETAPSPALTKPRRKAQDKAKSSAGEGGLTA